MMAETILQLDFFESSQNKSANTTLREQDQAREIAQSAIPFRTILRVWDTSEMDPQGIRNDSSPEKFKHIPVEKALHLARTTKNISDKRLDFFIHHPDERVPIALTENPERDRGWGWARRKGRAQRMLYERAIRDADIENVVWTPLLDALASNNVWPSKPYYVQKGSAGDIQTASARARALVPWIEQQTDPGAFEDLWEFRYKQIRECVARHARCLNAAWIHRILQDVDLISDLADNPWLTQDQRQQLHDWALTIFRNANNAKDDKYHYASSVLIRLQAKGWILPKSTKNLLIDRVGSRGDLFVSYHRFAHRPQADTAQFFYGTDHPRAAALSVLMGTPNLSSEELIRIFIAIEGEAPTYRIEELIQKAGQDVMVLRYIAQRSTDFQVRSALLKNDTATQDTIVRDCLARSSSPYIHFELCRSANNPKQFGKHFAHLARHDPERALHVLGFCTNSGSLIRLKDFRELIEGSPRPNKRQRNRNDAISVDQIRFQALLWLRNRPLVDDPPSGHPGEVAERYVREYLPIIFQRIVKTEREDDIITLLQHHSDKFIDLLTPDDLMPLLQSSNQQLRLACMLALQNVPAVETIERRSPGRAY